MAVIRDNKILALFSLYKKLKMHTMKTVISTKTKKVTNQRIKGARLHLLVQEGSTNQF